MFSLENICDALAACYAGTAIGTPTNATAMRATYGQMPNNIPMTPCVVIMPKTGEAIFGAQTWDTTHQIDALFYHQKSQGDIPRSETERQRWLPYLLSATKSHGTLQLSASGVKSAMPTGYEFVTLTYGGEEYDGIVIHYDVIVRESITLVP